MIDIVQRNGRSQFCKDRFVGGWKIRRMNGNRNTDPKEPYLDKRRKYKKETQWKGGSWKIKIFY